MRACLSCGTRHISIGVWISRMTLHIWSLPHHLHVISALLFATEKATYALLQPALCTAVEAQEMGIRGRARIDCLLACQTERRSMAFSRDATRARDGIRFDLFCLAHIARALPADRSVLFSTTSDDETRGRGCSLG